MPWFSVSWDSKNPLVGFWPYWCVSVSALVTVPKSLVLRKTQIRCFGWGGRGRVGDPLFLKNETFGQPFSSKKVRCQKIFKILEVLLSRLLVTKHTPKLYVYFLPSRVNFIMCSQVSGIILQIDRS